MAEFTNKQLQERYRSLPEDLKDAIFSEDVTEHILSIGKEYRLSVEQVGELADETGLVFLGITSPDRYISNLARRLDIERDLAAKIGSAINEQIFRPVRESLKKINGIDGDSIENEFADTEQKTFSRKPPLHDIRPAARAQQSAAFQTSPKMPPPEVPRPPDIIRAPSSPPAAAAMPLPKKTEEPSRSSVSPDRRTPAPFVSRKTSGFTHAAPLQSVINPPPATEGKKEKERIFEQLLKERGNAAPPHYGERDPYREPTDEMKGGDEKLNPD